MRAQHHPRRRCNRCISSGSPSARLPRSSVSRSGRPASQQPRRPPCPQCSGGTALCPIGEPCRPTLGRQWLRWLPGRLRSGLPGGPSWCRNSRLRPAGDWTWGLCRPVGQAARRAHAGCQHAGILGNAACSRAADAPGILDTTDPLPGASVGRACGSQHASVKWDGTRTEIAKPFGKRVRNNRRRIEIRERFHGGPYGS